eukprot:9437872-Pyramimonas_sp.AAC.1
MAQEDPMLTVRILVCLEESLRLGLYGKDSTGVVRIILGGKGLERIKRFLKILAVCGGARGWRSAEGRAGGQQRGACVWLASAEGRVRVAGIVSRGARDLKK